MKNLFFVLSLLIGFSFISINSKADNRYKVDESQINLLFENASDVTYTSTLSNLLAPSISKIKGSENTQLIAGIVALAQLVLGIGILIPIHRIILGTGNQTVKIVGLYCITLSGCGFITLIDGIMLLIDAEGSQYIENSNFLMWM